MRKKRILGAALLLVTVLSMAFALVISSGASEGSGDALEVSEPRIAAKNISYEAELYTCYAVPCSTVAPGAEIWLEVLSEAGEVISTVTSYRTENVHGITCYTFKGNGTSPRNIGHAEYVRAVTSDGGVSPTVEYSVLEYLCEKLCKEGYLNFTSLDGKEYTRRKLYLQLYKYACSAQNLLGSAGFDLEDICYVGADGALCGFYDEGEQVKISYDESRLPKYREFVSWNVRYYGLDGSLISENGMADGGEVTSGGFVCVSPIYNTSVPEGVVAFFDDTSVTISIMGSEHAEQAEIECAEAIAESLSRIVTRGRIRFAYGSVDPDADVNIIIGESDEACSRTAYARLKEIRSTKMYSEAKYVIAAEGGAIAIAYDENEYTTLQSVGFAAARLLNSFSEGGGMIEAKDFVSDYEIDLVEVQRAKDAVTEEGEWARLLEAAVKKYGAEQGKAITDALCEYYSMRSDELIIWYANLYDPGIGGFYASTTGKKYDGFLPPIETTGQLLGHLSSLGVFSAHGNSTKNALPFVIKAQLIYFAKSLQDPNGYFYNPQLGKAASDATVVRRGRDLSRATSMLSSLGSKPTYDTPTGTKGDGITADEYWASTGLSDDLKPYVPTSLDDYREHLWSLTGSVSADAAEAVGELLLSEGVVLTSDGDSTEASEAYLKSHAAFNDYIQGLNIDGSPYSIGNELNGTYRLIEAASGRLGAYSSAEGEEQPWYEGMTLCDMLISWMSSHINEKGLFGTIPEGSTDPLDGIRFANSNGFFKMITIYNAWKVEYPEPALAAEGLIAGIKGDEPSTGNICNVYNAWNALSSLMSNVRGGYGDMSAEDREAILADINAIFAKDAPAAIINSYNKQKAYRCEDGTFSNGVSSSASSYPGGLAVSFGAKEGNVDAIGFGLYATTNSILSVLGLSSANVAYYHEYNYLMFLEEILNITPVTKKTGSSINDKDFVQGFENYVKEENIRVTSLSAGGAGNTIAIVDTDGGKVVDINKIYGTSAPLVKQYYTYKEEGATKLVYGARIKLVELKKKAQIQFTVVSVKSTPFLVLIGTSSASTTSELLVNGRSTGIKANDWFDLRIEYQVTERDESGKASGFRTDVYINGKAVYSTTTFYNTEPTRLIYEVSAIDALTLSFNQPNEGRYLVDDVYMHAVK